MATVSSVLENPLYGLNYQSSLIQVGRMIELQEGVRISAYSYGAENFVNAQVAEFYKKDVIDYFFSVSDDHALDFLEYLCQTTPNHHVPVTTTRINKILQEEGVGFELFCSDFTSAVPQLIKKDGAYIHDYVIHPCLEALGDPDYSVASEEMLTAHEAYRKCNYAEVITKAGASLESVLKTICTKRGWGANSAHDTLATLVETCKSAVLFPSFYAEIIKNAGTIRNKLGDAHGRGPENQIPATKEYADHMLHLVSSHVNLLLKLASK